MKLKNLSIFLVFIMIITAIPFTASAAQWDPYEPITAGKFDETNDTDVIKPSNGGTTFGFAQKYIRYNNIEFTDAPYAVAVSIGIGEDYLYNNVVWLRLDSPTAEPFATIYITETNGWMASEAIEHIGTITQNITGKHDVYVSSSQPNNFFYFYFLAKRAGELQYKVYEETSSFKDTAGNKYEREIEAMNGLGMVSDFEDGFFRPDLPILRGEFASWVAHFMTSEIPTGIDNPFSDISDYKYMNEICYLYDNGLLKLNEDKSFKPYDFITVREASAILLRLMNYETMIEYKGGWPYGYDLIANDIGLTSAMSSDDYLRRGAAAKMLYNAIDAEYLEISSINNGNVTYERKTGILEKLRSLYKGTGVVNATLFSGISGDVTLPDSSCYIGNELFYLGEGVSVEHYLGAKCDYYYYSSDNGGTKTLLYIMPSSKITMLTLNSKDVDFEKITSDNITYIDKNKKEKKIKINSNANWIYNNKVLGIDVEGVITNPAKFGGKIRLIDNGKGWETIWIDNYKNIKIQSFSVNTNTLTDELSGERWCFEGKTLLVSDGKETIKPKNLKRGQLAELYLSYDGEFAVLLVGESTVTGEATEITSNGKIVIGNTVYNFAKESEISLKKDIILGQSSEFYFSRSGELVYVKTGSDVKSYGLLSEVAEENSVTYITLITASEKEEKFKTAKNVYVDGIKMKEYSDISVQLKSAGQYCPVLYNINDSNELTMIDTPIDGAQNEKDTLHKLNVDTSVNYMYKPNLLVMNPNNEDGSKKPVVPVTKNTVIITGRAHKTSGIDYSFTSINSANRGFYESYTFYSFEKGSKIADLLFIPKYNTYTYTGPIVFNGYTSSVDEYGNKGINAEFVNMGGEVKYFISDDYTDVVTKIKALKKGDLIAAQLGFYNDMTAFEIIAFNDAEPSRNGYNATVNKNSGLTADSNWTSSYVFGTVTEILEEFVVVRPFNYSEDIYMNINNNQVITVGKDSTVKGSMYASNIEIGDMIYGYNESTWKVVVVYEQ